MKMLRMKSGRGAAGLYAEALLEYASAIFSHWIPGNRETYIKKNENSYTIKLAIVGIFIFLLPLMVLGQSFLLQDLPTDKIKLGFRYLRPDFKGEDGEDNMSFLSGVYDFSASIPIGSNMNIEASLPFVTIGYGVYEGTYSESSIGNIYIGVRNRLKSTAEKGTSAAIGVFLPTAPEDKFSTFFMGYMGLITDFYELQKFIPNTLTIYGNITHHLLISNGLMFNMEIGPSLLIPPKDSGGNTELFVHYGLAGGYRTHGLVFKVELAGIAHVTDDQEGSNDNFTHFLVFGVQWNRGLLRPGIFYKLYLDEDWTDSLNGVIGIKLDVVLK